jgi:hypothetical protein
MHSSSWPRAIALSSAVVASAVLGGACSSSSKPNSSPTDLQVAVVVAEIADVTYEATRAVAGATSKKSPIIRVRNTGSVSFQCATSGSATLSYDEEADGGAQTLTLQVSYNQCTQQGVFLDGSLTETFSETEIAGVTTINLTLNGTIAFSESSSAGQTTVSGDVTFNNASVSITVSSTQLTETVTGSVTVGGATFAYSGLVPGFDFDFGTGSGDAGGPQDSGAPSDTGSPLPGDSGTSDTGSPSPGDSGTSSDAADATAPPQDSGPATDATAPGDGGTTTTTTGLVGFTAGGNNPPNQVGAYTIIGIFAEETITSTGHGGTGPCGAPVDGCTLCGGTDAGASPTMVSFTEESVGVLTIDDGSATLASLAYGADAGGDYEIDSNGTPSLAWNSGDVLHVSATGATFPAFSGMVTAPAAFAGVTPAVSLVSPIDVPTSGFTISWTPVNDGAQIQLILGIDAAMNSVSLSCTAADTAGQIVVPAALLTQLAGFGDTGGTVGLTRTVTVDLQASGGKAVTLQASPLSVDGTFNFN